MDFDEMQPIFANVTADWSASRGKPLNPFLLHVHGIRNDSYALRVIVSDFQSNTFEALKSHHQLEDMRDAIGIGGSWSEFVDYVLSSLKSEDVKLVLEGSSEAGGASSARLIAQKSKGMPRVSISLAKLIGDAAGEAMSDLSQKLYKEYKNMNTSFVEEQGRHSQLTKALTAEKEKSADLQKQLDMLLNSRKHKSQKINDNLNSDAIAVSQDSSDKQAAHNPSPSKVISRVVPAHRRSKVRGVVLEDTEDDV